MINFLRLFPEIRIELISLIKIKRLCVELPTQPLLQLAATRVTRPASLGPLEISITPYLDVDRDVLEQYAELGVQRLILRPPGADGDAIVAFIERMARLLG